VHGGLSRGLVPKRSGLETHHRIIRELADPERQAPTPSVHRAKPSERGNPRQDRPVTHRQQKRLRRIETAPNIQEEKTAINAHLHDQLRTTQDSHVTDICRHVTDPT